MGQRRGRTAPSEADAKATEKARFEPRLPDRGHPGAWPAFAGGPGGAALLSSAPRAAGGRRFDAEVCCVRRIPLLALLLLLAVSLLAGLHAYLGLRLVLEPGLPAPWAGLLLAALAGLALSLVLHPLAERRSAERLARILAWPAALWMGFLFLITVLLGVSDVVLWLLGSAAAAASGAAGGEGSVAGVRAAAVVAIAGGAGVWGLRTALQPPRRLRLEIPLARWPDALDGFRIVQISDVHIGPLLGRRFAEALVARVNALEPDLVAITGDLVDGSVRRLAAAVEPFARLRARHGVFFVTGNHDHYSNAEAWVRHLRGLGLRVLRNERVRIGGDAAAFDLIGVDDHHGDWIGGGGEDLPRALHGRDRGCPAVLLAHDPSTFKRASALGVDLQLSGHTHGGQIWPFGVLVRLAIPFVAGRYRRHGAELYVSRGTGFWGPPMRLFAPAEIGELVLRSAGAAGAGAGTRLH
jgi:predicted MPP superfamily phosphohydrolase